MSKSHSGYVFIITIIVCMAMFFAGYTVQGDVYPRKVAPIPNWEGNVVAVYKCGSGVSGTKLVVTGPFDAAIGASRVFVAEAPGELADYISPGDRVTGDFGPLNDLRMSGMVGGIPRMRWVSKEVKP